MERDNNIKEFSFLEPFGHNSPESKIERYWQRFSGPFTLNRHRIPQYSVYAGMTHFPLKYTMRPFNLELKLPTCEWVSDNLLKFIKTEFSEEVRTDTDLIKDWPPKIDKIIQLPSNHFDKFFESSEWLNRIKIKLPDENSPKEIANSIFDLLCDSRIGAKNNSKNNNRSEFINRIVPTINDKSRLLFVLPGFPFKDQNRFRVPFDGNIPDMSEISFMIRLYNLTQTMYQVHPYGVDVVILSDGELFYDIFGVPLEIVRSYMKRLIMYRNKLNLQGTISFISLKELIDRSSIDSKTWDIVRHISECIIKLVESGTTELMSTFNILVSGIKWNLDSRNSLKNISDDLCWKLLKGNKNDVEQQYKKQWQEIHDRAIRAALEYSSINLMLRWTNLISVFFPDAIRATIHPKPEQFALSGTHGSYAWNGVAYSKSWPKNIDDIRVVPYMSLCNSSKINQVKFENTEFPCFYTESTLNFNIESAKNILPSKGWNFENIFGREFSNSDLKDFINLGLGDEYFSWERKYQDENYFIGLFQFRLSHYKKYGFGIHGLWIKDKLVGQLGLQVLKEDLDEIEIIIFLGKDFVHKGLGSKLIKYIIKICREKGIRELYGVVRPDNNEGINLLKKINSEQIKTVKHFNVEGILHRINLDKK